MKAMNLAKSVGDTNIRLTFKEVRSKKTLLTSLGVEQIRHLSELFVVFP